MNGWSEIFIKNSHRVTRISTDESINEKDEGAPEDAGDAISWKSWIRIKALSKIQPAPSVPATFQQKRERERERNILFQQQ